VYANQGLGTTVVTRAHSPIAHSDRIFSFCISSGALKLTQTIHTVCDVVESIIARSESLIVPS
jgi:hypothetical protein